RGTVQTNVTATAIRPSTHLARRAQERHNVVLSPADVEAIATVVGSGRAATGRGYGATPVHLVERLSGPPLPVVARKGAPVTALPRDFLPLTTNLGELLAKARRR